MIAVSVRISMPKQAHRQRAAPQAGPRTTLLDLWRGDLSEVVAAFLPLESIATVPLFSRRFRDRHPIVLFALARRHGCANAVNASSLDAIAATGRDWSRFAGGEQDDWLRRSVSDVVLMNTTDEGVRHIELCTTERSYHNGGLWKVFGTLGGRLCVRRVRYRFRFTDPTPQTSHGDPDGHGFAYFAMGEPGQMDGVYVRPTHNSYVLTCLSHETDNGGDLDFSEDVSVMDVEPDTWYDVEMSFAWHKDDATWARVTCKGEEGSSSVHFPGLRLPLRTVKIYNYSAGVACYSAIEVCYSPPTSRDGPFAYSDTDSDSDSD